MDSYESALAVALKRLRAGDRSEAEIRELLGSSETEVVDRVVLFLKERRIIDDDRTARNLLAARSGRHAVGNLRLQDEFTRRGLPESVIGEAPSEADRMQSALQGKFGRAGDRMKAARFLCSRGFDEDMIEGALDRFFQSEGAEG